MKRNLKYFSIVLPLIGACMMAALGWKSLFIVPPLTDGMYLWLVVLLLPYGLAVVDVSKGIKSESKLRQLLGLAHSILLGVPAALGLVDNWNGEIIALFPLYLWPVTFFMILAGIAADGFYVKYGKSKTNSRI